MFANSVNQSANNKEEMALQQQLQRQGEQRQEQEQEVLLPGFRFHPTDEELVGYYLRRRVMLRPPSVDVITELDIYKFDPWDLPKIALAKGEKEWYFFCPRDRKYRNSARPNRVTGAGFWKATGTDRPIYSADGSKCIGLKKSLVFYRGRAAKGTKTDWMMHEFRLPASTDTASALSRIHSDEIAVHQDAWAVCRIFKKSTLAQRNHGSQHWAVQNQHTAAHGQSFGVRESSPIGDLELPSSPERSDHSNSEAELEMEGSILQPEMTSNFTIRQYRQAHMQAANLHQHQHHHHHHHHDQQQQFRNTEQNSGATWQPVNMAASNMNNSSMGTGSLLVESTSSAKNVNNVNNMILRHQQRPSNLTVGGDSFPLEVMNSFLTAEGGALDFVNCILNSPRGGSTSQLGNSANTNVTSGRTANCNGLVQEISNQRSEQSIQQQQQHLEGILSTNNNTLCPIAGQRMNAISPNMEKFRRNLSLQIPQGPPPQPFCGMQGPWDMLSPIGPIFDLSTPSNQLECM